MRTGVSGGLSVAGASDSQDGRPALSRSSCKGRQGERRAVAGRGHEDRRVGDDEVLQVVEPAVGVDQRRSPGRRPCGRSP